MGTEKSTIVNQSSLMYVFGDNTANYFVLQFDFVLISWVDTNETIICFIHELRTERSDWRDSVLYFKRVKALGCSSVLTRDWTYQNLFHCPQELKEWAG